MAHAYILQSTSTNAPALSLPYTHECPLRICSALQDPLVSHIVHLCLPKPFCSLHNPHIRRLKLIQPNARQHGRPVQRPDAELPQLGPAPGRHVVDNDSLHAHVGVHQQRANEQRVQRRVQRAAGKGRDRQRHQRGGDDALKDPVVVAVGGRWRGDGRGVVDGALDDLCRRGERNELASCGCNRKTQREQARTGSGWKQVPPACGVEGCDLGDAGLEGRPRQLAAGDGGEERKRRAGTG